MRRNILSVALLLMLALISSASAQNVFYYKGAPFDQDDHTYHSNLLGRLEGIEKQSYQGMDVWGQTVVSAQNTGVITLYHYDGKELRRCGEPFVLASNDKENHANVLSMSRTFYQPNDPLPLIYVSQCARGKYRDMKDVLFVERIKPDQKSSELLQTIYYKDDNHHFGYALQWVLDNENGFLYGYGNTIDNRNPQNRHRIVKFRLPEVKDTLVVLTDADLLENYLIEDTYHQPFNPVGQGLFIHNNLLFMPVGLGTEKDPSFLYIWDLARHRMYYVIDLSVSTQGELEDCAAYGSGLLIQTQGALYRLDF